MLSRRAGMYQWRTLEVLRNKRERCASGFDPINQNRGIDA
jgi:hypothetical protein